LRISSSLRIEVQTISARSNTKIPAMGNNVIAATFMRNSSGFDESGTTPAPTPARLAQIIPTNTISQAAPHCFLLNAEV
jgi:hypothetical protein